MNTILIVDDEPAILSMLTEYFRSLDYQTLNAPDAESAAKILASEDPIDLVISDIDLPGMSGIDLLQISREAKPDVPVIMITGLKTLDFAISAVKHGAHDYITKPFKLADVKKVAEKVLRYRRSSLKREKIFEYAQSMRINLDFPTAELDAGVVADYLARFLLNAGFCSKPMFHQFHVAFMETILNAVEHGNLELPSSIKDKDYDFAKVGEFEELRSKRLQDPHYGQRMIRIGFQYSPKMFSLNITDEGPGFDWHKYVSENNQFDGINTAPYGRGFMLILHIIDEVYFNESGNSITLVKSRPEA